MAGKKVQVPVLGGLRKVIQVPTSQNVGTTIQEFGSQIVSLAQLKAALGVTSSKGTTVAGGAGSAASLIVGPGMSGGGVLTGAVNIGLLQPISPVVWNEALLPDDWIGSGGSGGGGGGGTASPLTTKGDVYVFGTGNTRLPVGVDGQILTARSAATNGVDWESITNSSLAYVNTTVPAGNTVANTAAATAFASSYTIPAGYLPVGAVIRVVMKGVYSTAALSPTISIALKFGATVLLTTGAVSPLATSATNDGWSYEALLVAQSTGVSGAIESQGTAVFQTATTGAAVLPLENTAPITVDTTIAQAVTAVVTWGTANASNTITLREMAIWIEGVAPSSGGSGGGNVTPDTHPASPNVLNDEFEGTTLDPKWIWLNQGSFVNAFADGSIFLYSTSANGVDDIRAITQPISGTFDVRAKAYSANSWGTDVRLGIYVGLPSDGKACVFGWYNGGGGQFYTNNMTNSNTILANLFVTGNSTGPIVLFNGTPWMYLRVVYDGTSLFFYASSGGVSGTYLLLGQETTASFLGAAPTVIGVYVDGSVATSSTVSAHGAIFDWFRRIA